MKKWQFAQLSFRDVDLCCSDCDGSILVVVVTTKAFFLLIQITSISQFFNSWLVAQEKLYLWICIVWWDNIFFSDCQDFQLTVWYLHYTVHKSTYSTIKSNMFCKYLVYIYEKHIKFSNNGISKSLLICYSTIHT